ncbi:Asp-tRNA(Asn)/Glu-tRNA(Gln) amidotransferase subunit GatA [bacterium]|nr:Asp-tRNA(Asn)/Glu-tRNA(Gln) amidotransferase subunit GatA [bacterium]
MRELLARPGHELLDLIEDREVHPYELSLEQARLSHELDSQLDSFTVWNDLESRGPLPYTPQQDGIRRFSQLPYAAKDVFCTSGLQTTAGSRILKGYIPPFNSTLVDLLERSGSYLLGKTNMDEFAMGSSGETCAYGHSRNPWHLDYVPGGSSSGSVSSVAGCQAVMALGTDTGGSVRQPASFCGVVGFRPTYGQLSRYGMVAYSSSCDQAAVFTRCSLDCALAMNTLSQPDPQDSTCHPSSSGDYFEFARREVHWEKLRVGVIREFTDPGRIDAPVLANYRASLDKLAAAGTQIVELDFPLADYCLPAYYIITAAECSSNLARYDGIRYGPASGQDELLARYVETRGAGFGAEVKRRILLGTYVLSKGYQDSYYDRARRLRRDIRDQLLSWFESVDIIATPTSPTLAFPFGARNEDPVRMYIADLCTVFVNLAGTAGISVPNGFGSDTAPDGSTVQLPTGLQLVCAPWSDELLLRVAHNFELLSGWRYTPPQWIAKKLGIQAK